VPRRRTGWLQFLRSHAHVRPTRHSGDCACRRSALDDHRASLAALARECADGVAEVHHEVIWTGVPHQAILGRCRALHADYVVKDIGRTSALRRLLFTPLDWQLMRELPANLLLVRPESAPALHRILVAVDALAPAGAHPDLNNHIIEAATALASGVGAKLELASVDVTPGPAVDHCTAPAPAEIRDRHDRALRALAQQHGVPAEHVHALEGSAIAALGELVARRCIGLVAVGNVHRNAVLRLLSGSTAEALLQELECDLLVINDDGPAATDVPEHRPAAQRFPMACV